MILVNFQKTVLTFLIVRGCFTLANRGLIPCLLR
jgi:hypothetical protein